jgi:hypothetical protein
MGKAADAARALLPKPLQLFATHMDIVRQITDVVELLRQVEGTPRDAPQSVLYNITEEQLKELELRAGQVGAMVQAMLYIQTYNRDKGTFVDDWTFETIAAVSSVHPHGGNEWLHTAARSRT